MATKDHTEQGVEALSDAVRKALGDHPEDVMGVAATATDVFYWLEMIFKNIEEAVDSGRAISALQVMEVSKMAAMGRYLSSNFGNYMDCSRERMVDSLRSAGYKITPIKAA